jgi:hypothetical protein
MKIKVRDLKRGDVFTTLDLSTNATFLVGEDFLGLLKPRREDLNGHLVRINTKSGLITVLIENERELDRVVILEVNNHQHLTERTFP